MLDVTKGSDPYVTSDDLWSSLMSHKGLTPL